MNKRFSTLILALALASGSLFAQASQADSLTFVKAKWDVKKIGKGITWKQYHFKDNTKIFDAEEFVNIIEIDQKKAKKKFIFTHNPGSLTRTSDWVKQHNATLGINGSFYNTKAPYNSVCYFKVDGQDVFVGGVEMSRQNASIMIDKNGRLSLAESDPASEEWRKSQTAPNILNSGPMLIVDGERAELSNAAFNTLRHPRTAIATSGDKVYLITVDGRSKGNSLGVSLFEFASICKWIGAQMGMNLDGGGSTTMVINGQGETGVVNRPCDNTKFDTAGERRVSNALLLL